MTTWRTRTAAALCALGLATGLAACSNDTTTPSADPSATSAAENMVLLDVRTPAEFAEGHVEGAINIDFNAPTFDQDIAALDHSATYGVYCRSGNRAGQAVKKMEGMGFAHASNLGSVKEASEVSGDPVVTGAASN